jgi:hypothetical protein
MMVAFVFLILLFILSFEFTQSSQMYGASEIIVPQYVFLFVLLVLVGVTFLFQPREENTYFKFAQNGLFFLIVVITIGHTTFTAIDKRHQLGFDYPVHDNPVQIEEGIKFLKMGKNPYTENYHDTLMFKWNEWHDNPALFHFVTLPFYLISSYLTSYPAEFVFGFYDQRMIHILTLLFSVALLAAIIKQHQQRLLVLTIFLFNPLLVHFFIEGRNDIFVFSWVLFAMWLVWKKWYVWSALVLGLAFASKQSSWLILPFYFWYIWLEVGDRPIWQRGLEVLQKTWPFFVVTVLFFIPFLISDAQSFINDIYHFPAGTLKTSYYIKGYGFSELLVYLEVITDRHAYYPFAIWQLVFGIPTMIALFWWQTKQRTIPVLIISYTLLLFVFWFFSRFFVENYVGYLSMLFIAAYSFWLADKPQTQIDTPSTSS